MVNQFFLNFNIKLFSGLHDSGDRFNVIGMREHIHRLDLDQPVTVSHHPDIPCQGGRVAGNIDDALYTQLKHLFDNILVHSCPGWVNNQHIRPLLNPGEALANIAPDEGAICHTLFTAIYLGVGHRTVKNINYDDLPAIPGQ
jgi:hypothetical protein